MSVPSGNRARHVDGTQNCCAPARDAVDRRPPLSSSVQATMQFARAMTSRGAVTASTPAPSGELAVGPQLSRPSPAG